MTTYKELMKKQQAEVNDFPLHFCFGQEQIDKKIKELNLDKEKLKEQIVPIGYGGFVLKKDFPQWKNLVSKHHQELQKAISEDPDGSGFICDMFTYELENHECNYTGDPTDALNALGYSLDEINANPCLVHGLELAMEKCDCWL